MREIALLLFLPRQDPCPAAFNIYVKPVIGLVKTKMKQQTHDKLNAWRTRKKSEPQMGFEPTTLRDLVGCSNH